MGLTCEAKELPDSTRTAVEAAKAIGCGVEQIAKSLIFRGKDSQKPYLVIASGGNRVNEEILSQLVGEKAEKADADFVEEVTGFTIGGVPPAGHKQKLPTWIDRDLLGFEEIWAAAGSDHAVFKLTPKELVKITGGEVAELK